MAMQHFWSVHLRLLGALPMLLLAISTANASLRIVDDIQVESNSGESTIRINLKLPMRYLTHAPKDGGNLLQIQLQPISGASTGAASTPARETIAQQPTEAVPLQDVTIEADRLGGYLLALKFRRRVQYTVAAGKDFRSVVIQLPASPQGEPGSQPDARDPEAHSDRPVDAGKGLSMETLLASTQPNRNPPPGHTLPQIPVERLNELMDEARDALTAGDNSRAVQLLTKILRYPEHQHSRQAQEFLGLARERKKQLAHAKAEYQEFLRRYPEGEDAQRVRQRLITLITADKGPKQKLRAGKNSDQEVDWEVYGSLSQFYDRSVRFTDVEGETVERSELSTDLYLTSRLRSESYDLRAQFTGDYTHDFLDDQSEASRVTELYVDARDHKRDLFGRLGRQSRSTGGVFGRFDGAWLGYDIAPETTLNAVFGFPTDSQTQDSVNTDKYFYGASVDFGTLAEHWDFNAFLIEQQADGHTDRRAIGGEVRYFAPGRSVFGLLDYDIYYNELNTFLLFGNWTLPDSTTLNLSFDYRKTPTLSTSNALIGQTVDSLSSLADTLSASELRSLADDRTATSRMLTLGASRPLNERFQVSADVTVSKLSGTPASGGVEATPATGYENHYSTQLLASNLFTQGDISILGLRYFDADQHDTVSLDLNTRFPLSEKWRINPRLRLDYRQDKDDDVRTKVRSSALLDYRRTKRLRFEFEAGGEWNSEEFADRETKSTGYFLSLGYRWDF